MGSLSKTGRPRAGTLAEILLVALTYIVFARLGQLVAIPPGNVTPVWLPSGLMLAWALIRGPQIWPGVFLGAALGNGWAYLDFESPENVIASVLAGSMNGFGDVLATSGSAYIIRRHAAEFDPLRSVNSVTWLLIVGAAGGSLASAVFGVTGLAAAGFLDFDAYFRTMATWWTGDAIGVITLTCASVLLVRAVRQPPRLICRKECAANLLLLSAAGLLALAANPNTLLRDFAISAIPPLMIWAAVRLPMLYSQLLIIVFAAANVLAATAGVGPFSDRALPEALISTQLLVGTVSIVILYLSSARSEIRTYLDELQSANSSLERKVRERTAELEEARKKAEMLALTDSLTGIPNRRHLTDLCMRELKRVRRYRNAASLVVLDIDDFKKINDDYGHPVGDDVLRDLTETIRAAIRDVDVFGRLGGEEFILMLPDTPAERGVEIADRLRKLIEARRVGADAVSYRISCGVTDINSDDQDLDDILIRADKALYAAKRRGKNQVVGSDKHQETNGQDA
jgi:diguanylate cyclase (GGDEF)-like protein